MSDILILDNDKNEDIKKSSNTVKNNNQMNDNWGSLMDKINLFLLSLQKIQTKDKVLFYRLLATMTNAWMSVL